VSSDGRIELDNPIACQKELERVANGIAKLTVEYTNALTEHNTLEGTWELVEAGIYAALDMPKGTTAAVVKAEALSTMQREEKVLALRDRVREADTEIKNIERRLRSLEKRLSAAQSAMKANEMETNALPHYGLQSGR
jgi:uncharacterized coiled-coil protein SlyX